MKWEVLTPDNPPVGDYVYVCTSPRGYENLTRNEADVIRWIREAAFRLEYFKDE